MTVFAPLSTQPVFLSGQIQIGAIIQIFDAGTLTPRTAYRDGLAISPWVQATPGSPVPAGALVTDGNGCIPNFWIVGSPYKARITSAKGVQIREVDYLPGDTAAGGGGGGGGATLPTGMYAWFHTTAVLTGFVRANGKTIGSAVSGATERANADTATLFAFLWNADTSLAVSGGRGVSAAADFAANKTIVLPDLNCRTLFGIDGMGSSVTNRLTGATFTSGNATTLGSAGGEGAHTLTTAESAAHTHTGTTQANAAFQMTFTTASAGSHSHTASTGSAGAHNHGGLTGSENANHTHTLTTSNAGDHDHGGVTGLESVNLHTITTLPVNNVTRSFANVNGGSLGSISYVSDVNFTTAQFNVGPDHTHSISSDGTHSHTGSTSTQSTNHQHSVSTDGTHSHSISADGVHVHTGTTDLGGSHTHTITTNSTGGGGGHNNMSPFVLATCYLVL